MRVSMMLLGICVLFAALEVVSSSQLGSLLDNTHRETTWIGSADKYINPNHELSPIKQQLLAKGRQMAEGHMTSTGSRPCPCSKKYLCEIIRKVPKREIFVFSIQSPNWRHYDWSRITTICTFNYFDDDIMCWAHEQGIKVVHGADFPKDMLLNATARHLWVASVLDEMKSNFLDGVNVDFEQRISDAEPAYRDGLTELMKELNVAAKAISPFTQITFDFASTPNVKYRRYDYKALADVIDFAFVMDYDEDGGTYASANSPFDKTKLGLEYFMSLGIPPNKLVTGLPWYGFWYWCDNGNMVNHRCETKARGQITYSKIMEDKQKYSITGRMWDDIAKSPFFEVRDPINKAIYQIWYDDPESLSIKFDLIKSMNLRGGGNWHADALNYSDPEQVKDMWGAFPIFHSDNL